jgi:hypothetical protein
MACYNAPNNRHYKKGHEKHLCCECAFYHEDQGIEGTPCYVCFGAVDIDLHGEGHEVKGKCNWERG